MLAAGLLGLRDIIDPPKDDRPVVEQFADDGRVGIGRSRCTWILTTQPPASWSSVDPRTTTDAGTAPM